MPGALLPIWPHVRAYHSAPGADRFGAKVPKLSIVRPSIGIDHRAVVAKSGGAIDQQSPAAVSSQVTERDRRPSIWRGWPRGRRVIAGIAGAHLSSLPDTSLTDVMVAALTEPFRESCPSALARPIGRSRDRVLSGWHGLAHRDKHHSNIERSKDFRP